MLTRRLAIPLFCQVPARNSGLLLKLPITLDDGLMSEASQRRISLRPSLYDTSSHASLVRSGFDYATNHSVLETGLQNA